MSDNAVFKKISEYPSVGELSTEQKEAYLNSAEILSIGSTSVGADLTNYRIPLSDIGGGGGGGDDVVYVDLGDIETGIPVGQTSKWDEIAEHLVAGESVVGRVTSSSGKLDATPVTRYSFPWLMTALSVSTVAELKAVCEEGGMADILTILFGFEQDGATVKVDVTTADGIIPRYMMDGSTLEISEIGLNMDTSLRPTNVHRYEIQDNKYVPDIYGYLDDDIEELLRDIVSTYDTCKFTGWMGNTPGESTPYKFYGENIPAQIKLVDEPESGNTTIQIDASGIVLKNDSMDTPVPAMWRGEFEFKALHDYNRYWQTKDTAFELATVNG